ncbi:MAG: hypothetical protein HOB26_10380, partial [Flavobacteriales bacterium]|nr:hypothetical protein [Flavobacteriales bacterium]
MKMNNNGKPMLRLPIRIVSVVFALMLLLNESALGQCGYDNVNTGMVLDPAVCDGLTSSFTNTITGGDYVTTNVIAGNTYTWTTCGSAFDTELTVYPAGGGASLAYNDDACGAQSTVVWVATFTGAVEIMLDEFFCSPNNINATLSVTCAVGCPPSGANEYYICEGGTVNICNGTFFDAGGSGNYNPGDNNLMTFCSPSGDAIELDFTSWGMGAGDIITIYDNNTNTGTPLFSGSTNPGTIYASGTTGCLTVEFVENGAGVSSGWEADINCLTCSDGIQNQGETAVDCGGPNCGACLLCGNGIQDPGETGIDCGGPCVPCHCYDNVLSGNETSIDCGGDCPALCPIPCNVDITYALAGTGVVTYPGGPDYLVSTGGTVNTCGGTFYDPGGVAGNYGVSDLYTMTFCSNDPDPNSQIVFDFTYWDLEGCCDFLSIYDGTNATGQLLYSGDGADPSPGNVISSSGCLYFNWDSDFSVQYPGWAANIGCYIPPSLGCNGGDVDLFADGQGTFNYILNNDFDNGTAGTGWNTNITADYSNPCDASIDGGTYMWMGNNAPHPRTIETVPLDLQCGGEICFFLDFATQGNATPCEGIDYLDEGIYFEYSTDNGATWTTIEYFGPNGVGNTTQSGGTNPQMTAWNEYCYTVPPGAETAASLFHWSQTGSSGLNNDHWGIDNVTIAAALDCTPYVYDWDFIAGSPDSENQTTTVTQTTTFNVTYTNGNESCSTDVPVVVPDAITVTAAVDQDESCTGACNGQASV